MLVVQKMPSVASESCVNICFNNIPSPGMTEIDPRGGLAAEGCMSRGSRERTGSPLSDAMNSVTTLPRWLSGQERAWQCRRRQGHGFDPWVRKIPWRRAWRPSIGGSLVSEPPGKLPGKSHGQRSLAGYSPWGQRVGQD